MGDSKTQRQEWQPILMREIAAAGALQQPFYADAARDNGTVADAVPGTPSTGVDALIDNTFTSTNEPARRFIEGRDAVTHILCNWGVNDIAGHSLPVEATWKANYLSIIDYVHGRFPQATIHIMRPWRAGYDAEAATLKGWIDEIVAARSTFVALGPDEAVWLKGGDDGASTTDAGGVHYNALGVALCAAAWRAVLGY